MTFEHPTSTKTRRPAVALCIVALSCAPALLPTVAFAQGAPGQAQPDAAAKKLALDKFNRGHALYKEGSLDAALVEFQGAYAITPSFKILYNIAMVHRDKKDYRQALATFERFLVEGGTQIDAAKRKEVEKEVATLKGFVGSLSVMTTPPGAQVRIDDDPSAAGPVSAHVVNAGNHRVTVTMDGYRDAVETVAVGGQESKTITVTLQAIAKPTPVVIRAPAEEPSAWNEISFALVGVTGALALGAGITGGLAFAGSQQIPETTFTGDAASEELESDRQRVRALAITTDVLAGSAAAMLAATFLYTYLHEPEKPDLGQQEPTVRVGLGGAGIGVEGGW